MKNSSSWGGGGYELFHPEGRTDGQTTDMTKLTVAFRNFANAPKKKEAIQ